MKSVMKSIALLAVVGSVSAYAQEKKEMAPSKAVTPYGLVQGYFNLADSERQNTPDFNLWISQFGFKAQEGIAKAQIEARMTGAANLFSKAEDKSAAGGSTTLVLRRAHVSLDLPSKTVVMLGRVRPGSAAAWGVDSTWGTNGFASMDGLWLQQGIELNPTDSMTFGLGYGNSVFAASRQALVGPKKINIQDSASKQEKAIVLKAEAKFSGITAVAMYGAEKSQFRANAKSAVAADTTITPPVVGAPATKDQVGDVTHAEGSLGYDMDTGISGGGWYERITVGKLKDVDSSEGGKLTVGAEIGSTKTYESWGVGINADTRLVGLTDMLQKGDKFTFGVSFEGHGTRTGDGDKSVEKKSDWRAIAVGTGYNVGGMTMELNFRNLSSDTEQWADSKGVPAQKKASNIAYLTGIYDF